MPALHTAGEVAEAVGRPPAAVHKALGRFAARAVLDLGELHKWRRRDSRFAVKFATQGNAMAVDAGEATALVAALAELARDGHFDLTDDAPADIREVCEALRTWLEGAEGNG